MCPSAHLNLRPLVKSLGEAESISQQVYNIYLYLY